MTDYIVAFDVETTGLDQKNDFVIQLGVIKFNSQTFERVLEKNWYIKPMHKYVISQGAFETHHLSQEFIEENGVSMREVAPEFLKIVEGCDYLTYNGNHFDVRMLYKDFQMAGYEFPIEGKKFYDSYGIECKFNPRTLEAVYANYTGDYNLDSFQNAHNAFADVEATIEVFKHQLQMYNQGENNFDDMDENNMISPEGSIRKTMLGDRSVLVFTLGKYRDADFYEICKSDFNYVEWFIKNVATEYTKNILREYYKKRKLEESK